MDNQIIFEIIGYLASTIIAISLLMKSLIRLRIINGIGALVFVIYGLLIEAYPVAVLNGIIVVIDIYYLLQMVKRSEYFSIMKVGSSSEYLDYFIEFHLEDIKNFFPNFSFKPEKTDFIFFVLRNTIPAGLVILEKIDDKGKILLDYALKDYRDFKIGSFIFEDNADILLNRGIEYLEAESFVKKHTRYLKQMGFVMHENNKFIKELQSHYIQEKSL